MGSKASLRDRLTAMYMDPAQGFISKDKMRKKLQKQGIAVTNKELDDIYRHNEVAQREKRIVVKKYHKITGPRRTFQIDVVVFPEHMKRQNKGIRRLFAAIDIHSRKAYAYPIKNNRMTTILQAYEHFINDAGTQVRVVEGDDEFSSRAFRDFNASLGVMVVTDVAKDDHITKSGNKLGFIDSFVRNLKNRVRRYQEVLGMICGSRGSGKTTVMIRMLLAYDQAKSFDHLWLWAPCFHSDPKYVRAA
jgi:transposase